MVAAARQVGASRASRHVISAARACYLQSEMPHPVRCAAASCRALVVLLALAAVPAAAQTGTITGVATTAVPAMRPLRVTMDMKVCGAEIPDDTVAVGAGGVLANVVVTLTGIKATAPYPDPLVTNDKCRFVPRVQLARPGAPTKTTSHDALLHTTNAQQEGGRTLFNVGLPVPNMVVTRPLNGPGLVRITCNTHQWMRGFIMVTDEMAAVTGADGSFRLTGVPPGTYELKVWHELLKSAPVKVTVGAGATAAVKLSLAR